MRILSLIRGSARLNIDKYFPLVISRGKSIGCKFSIRDDPVEYNNVRIRSHGGKSAANQ